jgi:hypothetical protein
MLRLLPVAALLALPTTACGKQPDDPAYAEEVAASMDGACHSARAQAPTPALANHLDRLCACTHKKVAATPMSRSDGQQARYEKIQAAMATCDKELGGVADAEDYRATGTQPPPPGEANLAVDQSISTEPLH